MRRLFKGNRKAEADRESSLGKDFRTPTTYISNVTPAPTHNLPGRDFMRLPDETASGSSLTDTLSVADPNYIFYRIYVEDGAIPSKTPFPCDPFLGRIKSISVPPPHTAKNVRRSIAKVECIEDPTSTSLFLTPYSQSPMGDTDKVAILNRTGPGSTPREPLALVAKISDSERRALESEGRARRSRLASAEESDTTLPEIRYLYYLLYANDYEMASKVAIDPEKPSLGRIRADSVPPPHSPASIKRCISRMERTPELAHADLFADISSDSPLMEGHISLRTDCPGVSPNEPMAIVQKPNVQVESPSIPNGIYFIKNRTGNIYWNVQGWPCMKTVKFFTTEQVILDRNLNYLQWKIITDANGNISMQSLYYHGAKVGKNAIPSWAGAELTGSTVPVPWRLIPADGRFFYLTTDINRESKKPRVPAAQPHGNNAEPFVSKIAPGSMATLKEGDQWQMWEFIRK